MELGCCLPGSDNELLIPCQDPSLQDLRNRLISSEGLHDIRIRHRQERVFCTVCQRLSEEPCWLHAKSVPDESVVPFALASLPRILHLDVCPNSSTGKKVVANARIPPHTVFGPLVAPLAGKYSDTCVYGFPSPDDGQLRFFQLDSELFSNWMRYVRFAENPAEENLAVYLRGSQIVFVTVRSILPGEELKVCYSLKYAAIIERANTLSRKHENGICCVTAIGSAKHTEHPPPLDPPKTPLEPCSNIIPADWDSDSLQAPIMTGNNESGLPNFQNSPHTLPSRAVGLHSPGGDNSFPPPVKRRCLADISDNAPSPSSTQESADLRMDDDVSAPPSPPAINGSVPPVKANTLREDSPEIEYHPTFRKAGFSIDSRHTEEPIISTDTVSRKSTLRSGVKAVLPPVETLAVPAVDTREDSEEAVFTGRYYMDVESDSDWAPENGEMPDENESDEDGCDMDAEQKSGRITNAITKKAKPPRMARPHSNEAPSGNADVEPTQTADAFAHMQHPVSRRKSKRTKEQKDECPVCHRVLCRLVAHLNQEHPEYASANLKHACETCGMRYQSMQVLRHHMTTHHPALRGAEPTAEARQVAIEYMQKTGWLSYFCASCNKYFPNKSLLDIHELSHRVLEDYQARPERMCPVCDFRGASFAELAVHTADHAIGPRERKQCLFCPDQVFVLPVHYKKNHPEYREIVSKDWQFDCQQCQMKFHSKIHLDAHMRIHNKHKCVYCALQFDSSRALSVHNQTHQKDGVFPCPMCARTFPLFKTFRVHYQRQHDVKSVLVCEVCQVVCRNRVRLKLHMQSHNKDYRHACTQCGKRFHAVRYLRAHVRWVHEGNLKEYKKDYLNKRKQKEQNGWVEAYKDPRKKLAFEDFPYKCHECQLGYMRRSTLMNHVKEKHLDMDPQNVPL